MLVEGEHRSDLLPAAVHQLAALHAPVLGVWPARRDLLGALRGADVNDAVADQRLLGLQERAVGDGDDAIAHARKRACEASASPAQPTHSPVADSSSPISPAACMKTSLSSWERLFQASVFW